ncbi:elongation factor P maturation arginine rhamnosyltransferase EarP [Parazoarcus communis]|uniref:Protein-arginine rhamnosyltransferase n=1 Tax=Parazoarcus communis SWub3 = DSM 12120 TaxID=1121029 RepID=A0A323V0T7_9RHOO|nr:elongation factor P maturation arginine rhamnosyltransferase EarP [Parazoarcus communis]NMG68562.1 elongation factor P maturation arginine rhamnosyltransferase EarP [Parazoarcus communis SWub3 = DSM 12120]PZA17703.1 elongation factor P maturation arginine rhamnosyltransferase EarP [Azoarcus communis] [Parazoarcus communis SWub3 = DSM 12120]
MSFSDPCRIAQWAIFCRVVDNFGDIGVCWRLARCLSSEHGLQPTLWVDDWAALRRLVPAAEMPDSIVDGVRLRHWRDDFPEVDAADVVIEAFACELPASYIDKMARRVPAPQWINLEYLSAEPWVEACHGLGSPHPRLPLTKHFFFPGFDPKTGGLLRECDLLAERAAFRAQGRAAPAWLAAMGLADLPAEALLVSLFAYEQPDLPRLLEQWQQSGTPVVVLVPEGRVLPDLARALGRERIKAGDHVQLDSLRVQVLPFSEPSAYDRLLWACDLNFVRGEDSFVRAQWAGRPLVWQIYHQDEGVHLDKLEAFLDRYCRGLGKEAEIALRTFWRAWNGVGTPAEAWSAYVAVLPELRGHAERWCDELALCDDLATALTKFCSHSGRTAG